MSFILHHYPYSPYAEKIRCLLGYTETPWVSCDTPEAPPREKLDLLSGGYSRIPILQDGADVYCDSNLIADRLAQLNDMPELSAYGLNDKQLEELTYFEHKVFFACVGSSFDFSFMKRMVKESSLMSVFKLIKDRIGMARSSRISMGSPKTAQKHIDTAIKMIAPKFVFDQFLGGKKPNIVDFGLYHCFWFPIGPGQKNILASYPSVEAWYLRMAEMVSEPTTTIDIHRALEIAKAAEPAAIPQEQSTSSAIGQTVSIQPADYRLVPVEGILVGETDTKWVIKRADPAVGIVHVHFPKRGYELSS